MSPHIFQYTLYTWGMCLDVLRLHVTLRWDLHRSRRWGVRSPVSVVWRRKRAHPHTYWRWPKRPEPESEEQARRAIIEEIDDGEW